MAHYAEIYAFCFKVWLKQNIFDMKEWKILIVTLILIYPTFFRW